MRAKTILALLFVASLGLAAVIVLRALPHRVAARPAPPRREALAAVVPLARGRLLRAQDVAWRPLQGPLEPGMVLRPDTAARQKKPGISQQTRAQVYGAAVRVAIPAGAPIRLDEIVKPGDRDFLAIVLTPGERAISIPVTTGGASTGLLSPGDHVDVILTQNFANAAPLARRSVSETIVQDLRVLTIDAPNKNTPGFGRTVTLEVTPRQAEAIDTAVELGKLSLTLRPAGTTAVAAIADRIASRIRPSWAGDVSPALGKAMPGSVAVPAPIVVIRGTASEAVKRH